MPDTHIGSIVSLIRPEPGSNTYSITQAELSYPVPHPSDPHTAGAATVNVQTFNFSFGPISIKGSVDISKLDANFSVVIFGISISSISGNLKQGIVLNINLFIVNGNLRFYLKNGKEIWVSANLNQPFGGGVHEDHKIFTI